MKKFLLAVVVASFSFVSQVHSAGYGAAGCGLGGMLIKENKVLHQIGAWILNGVLGNQTFGITSGTSECNSSGLVAMKQERFVDHNYHALAKEMASGEGEHLETLAGLLGCPVEPGFSSFVKENYPTIFKNDPASPMGMLASLKKELSGNAVFAASCRQL